MELDHAEAWDLAHHRYENSNLARCYIDLRNAVRAVLHNGPNPGMGRLREIEATVADSSVKAAHG